MQLKGTVEKTKTSIKEIKKKNKIKRSGTEINNPSTKRTYMYLVAARERIGVKNKKKKQPLPAFFTTTGALPRRREHDDAFEDMVNENFHQLNDTKRTS